MGSPFITERARTRAPLVVEHAAVAGGAALVSPAGDVILSAGEVDLAHAARVARRLGASRAHVTFRTDTACIQAGPVRGGWSLCVAARPDVPPIVIAERLRKSAHVLALALTDGAAPTGAPAAVLYA